MEVNIDKLVESGTNITIAVSINDLNAFAFAVAEKTRVQIEREVADKSNVVNYTPKQVCDRLGIDITTLWRWAKRGYLVPIKIGGLNRYRKSDIEKILNDKGGAK